MNDIQDYYMLKLPAKVPAKELLSELPIKKGLLEGAAMNIAKALPVVLGGTVVLGGMGFGVGVVGMTGIMLATAFETNFPENPRLSKFVESAIHVTAIGFKIAAMAAIIFTLLPAQVSMISRRLKCLCSFQSKADPNWLC